MDPWELLLSETGCPSLSTVMLLPVLAPVTPPMGFHKDLFCKRLLRVDVHP